MRDNHEVNNTKHKNDNNHHEDHHHGDHHDDHHEDHHHGDHRKYHHISHHQEEDLVGVTESHRNHERFVFDHADDNLLGLLDKCGHFMHHKRGGKRGQGRILRILAEQPEINQKELQDKLRVESGSMSEIVIKLENKGLITRAKDETDKRMTKLMITELGLELSKKIETRDTEDDKLLFGTLTDEEQEQLKALLKKMLQGWDENIEVFRDSRHCHAEGDEHCRKGGRRYHKHH